VDDPRLSHEVNVNGTFNMLMAAREQGVRRFVYAASSSAYGEVDEAVKHEGIVPAPLSPYAVNKLVGEHYLSVFHACYGLETLSLRYFNVFGARQDPSSTYAAAIPAFAMAILRGQRPTVYGDGEQTRDFTFIDNVVEANVKATEAVELRGQVVNVACGAAVSVNYVIKTIADYTGTPTEPTFAPVRAGDVKHSLADISLAKRIIGYEPRVAFDDGLRQAVDWYRDNLL
jgi:nucleoside-diphosphate-sugar epimerase